MARSKRNRQMAVAAVVSVAAIFALAYSSIGRGGGDVDSADLGGASVAATSASPETVLSVAEAVAKRVAPVIEGQSESAPGGGPAGQARADGSAGQASGVESAEGASDGDVPPATSLPRVAEPPEDTVLMLEPEAVAAGLSYDVRLEVYGTGPEASTVVVHVLESSPSKPLSGAFDPRDRNLVATVDAATLESLEIGVDYRATLYTYATGQVYGLRLEDMREAM